MNRGDFRDPWLQKMMKDDLGLIPKQDIDTTR